MMNPRRRNPTTTKKSSSSSSSSSARLLSSLKIMICVCLFVTLMLVEHLQKQQQSIIINGGNGRRYLQTTSLDHGSDSSNFLFHQATTTTTTTTTPTQFWNYTKDVVRPYDDNTVIAIVSMGESRNTFIAERCIRSIRARGNFTGLIMLYTDEVGSLKYSKTIPSWDPKVLVVEGRPDDLQPKKKSSNGTIVPIKYRRETLIYKRFKTLVLEYLDYIDDTRTKNHQQRLFDQTRYVFYVDVDNVIANPLQNFFDDYYNKISTDWIAKKKELASSTSAEENFSFFSLWRDPGADGQVFQGGQQIHDRHYSKGCDEAWRHQLDNVWRGMDQPLLMNVVNNFKRYNCIVFELPGGDGDHFDLLHTYVFKADPQDYPTMVHITSFRVTDYDKEPQEAFIRNALLLDDGSMPSSHGKDDPKTLPVDSYMVEDYKITWRQITLPVGAGGIKHEE